MDIAWLGHSCFRLRNKEVTLLTDPFSPDLGYPWPNPTAQIVTVSHGHPGHNYIQGIGGQPRVIAGLGEYEVGGVFIQGVASFHDEEKGKRLGSNTIYLMEMDGLRICHLGDLGHALPVQQVEEMGRVDVLLIPVGGGSTLGPKAAAQMVRQMEPKLVLPMHYKVPGLNRELEPVEHFGQEIGLKLEDPLPRLSVTPSNLPAEVRVVVLGVGR